MKKQHVGEREVPGTGSISEPEVTYVRQGRSSRTRRDIPKPDGISQSGDEANAARKRLMNEFLAESIRIYETGDVAARKKLSQRMEAFMREENTMERRLERINWSLEQIRRGEYMTAEEADEAIRRDLPWLR